MLVSDCVPKRRVNALKAVCIIGLALFIALHLIGLIGACRLSKWMISFFMLGKFLVLSYNFLIFVDWITYGDTTLEGNELELLLFAVVIISQTCVIYLAGAVRRDILIAEHAIATLELPTTVQTEEKTKETKAPATTKDIPVYPYIFPTNSAQGFPTTPFMYYPQMMNPAYGYPSYVLPQQQQQQQQQQQEHDDEELYISPTQPLLYSQQ